MALANRILSLRGLKLGDWQGSAYILSGPTGQSTLVASVAALWPLAEQMRKCVLDPLDESLIVALEGH